MLNIHFEDLTSPHYSVRAKISKTLQESRDIELLSSFVKYVFDNDKSDLHTFLINILNDILNEVHERKTKWALISLLRFVSKDRTSTSKMGFDYIDGFFMNPSIFNHFKSFLIKSCWAELDINSRMIMTKIISKNKFSQLSNLLLTNFDQNDRELTIDTIKAFRKLNDRRGNRYIDDYLKSSDLLLQVEAIKALGHTGSFFDGYKIVPFLYSAEKSVQIESILAVRKLIGSLSLKHFKKLFSLTDSKTTKVQIIKQLGELSSRSAFKFLVKIYIETDDSFIRLETEHSLEIIDVSNKSELLLHLFNKLNIDQKCQFAVLLDSFNSPVIEEYLHHCIKTESSKLFTAYCISLLSSYLTPMTEALLRSLAFNEDDDNTTKLYAYDSLIKIKLKASANILTELPPDSLDPSLPQHQIYITYLSKLTNFGDYSSSLCRYLLIILSSNNIDNKYRALSCFKYVNDKASVFQLIELYETESDEYFKSNILAVLRSILYKNSNSLEFDVISCLPNRLYDDLNPYFITTDLLKKILIYLFENSNDSVLSYLSLKAQALGEKVSSIIVEEKDSTKCCAIASVALQNGVSLSAKADKKLKRLYFSNDDLKPIFLKYLLMKRLVSDKEFLISRYSRIMKFDLGGYLNKYMDSVL